MAEFASLVGSMKATFSTSKSKGFTLIELLVVIAIILTLAGISMVVVNGVRDRASKAEASSEISGLQQAIENYMLDTGRLPVAWSPSEVRKKASKDGQLYFTTSLTDDSGIMAILTNYMDEYDKKLNPKKTAYFNTKSTDMEGTPGLYFEGRGRVALYDPWGNPYHIILNANPDDRTPRVTVGHRMVTKNVAIYSVGKDNQGSTEDGHLENDEFNEDNVKSW